MKIRCVGLNRDRLFEQCNCLAPCPPAKNQQPQIREGRAVCGHDSQKLSIRRFSFIGVARLLKCNGPLIN